MATHKSAIKRHTQSLKRRTANRAVRATLRTTIKNVKALTEKGELGAAEQALRTAAKLLDKAAIHGVIHKNNARRNISRISKKLADAKRAAS